MRVAVEFAPVIRGVLGTTALVAEGVGMANLWNSPDSLNFLPAFDFGNTFTHSQSVLLSDAAITGGLAAIDIPIVLAAALFAGIVSRKNEKEAGKLINLALTPLVPLGLHVLAPAMIGFGPRRTLRAIGNLA